MSWLPSQSPEWKTAKYTATDRACPRRDVGRGSTRGAKERGQTNSPQPPVHVEVVIDSELFSHRNPPFHPAHQIVSYCCFTDSVSSVEQPWGEPKTAYEIARSAASPDNPYYRA